MTRKRTVDPQVSKFAVQEQPDSYDRWFRAKVQEAIDDPRLSIPHDQVRA
ncbi:MAG: type II toxin-antitoxin system RelB family antitoxin, partial [Advenella sp.]